MGFLERMSWLNSFHQAHDSKLQFLALHPGKFRILLHAFVLFQIFWDQLKILFWRDVDMEALKASCSSSSETAANQREWWVDPKCKMVLLKSYFTESWEVGGTLHLSMIQGKKWIPSAQSVSQEPRKAIALPSSLTSLFSSIFQDRLKGNPI